MYILQKYNYSTKIKVAFAAIFMLLVSGIFNFFITPDTPEISERKFRREQEKADLEYYQDLAKKILEGADIWYPDEYFISQVKNNSFNIYYQDELNFFCYTVKTPEPAASFLCNYEELDWFCNGYGRGIEWKYTQKNNLLKPYLDVATKVVVSEEEDYDIMMNRPHVAFRGNLVDTIKRNIPFDINEGDCFFVIDEFTRMEGWFYFKSTYNGEPFVGCYSVDGWDGNTTYEDLMALHAYTLNFQNYAFWISD